MTLATGTVLIDRYRVVRLLGQGGFGAVYRVWDLHLNSPFALKENLDTSPEAIRQFAREAQILANLHHPNLPRVTDHFSLPDQGQYLVMEYVEGEDLEEMRCKSTCQPAGSLPEEQVLTWISQILDALEYLHQPGTADHPPRYQACQYSHHPSRASDPGGFRYRQDFQSGSQDHGRRSGDHARFFAAGTIWSGRDRCALGYLCLGRYLVCAADRANPPRKYTAPGMTRCSIPTS